MLLFRLLLLTKALVLVCFLHAASFALAAESAQIPVLEIGNTEEALRLPGFSQVLRDESKKLSLSDITDSVKTRDQWVPLLQGESNFNWTNDTFWIRTQLRNSSKTPVTKFILFDFTRIDLVEAYLDPSGLNRVSRSGLTVPFKEWPVAHNDITIPIRIEAGEERPLFLKIRNSSTMQIGASLISESNLAAKKERAKLILTGFSCTVAVIFLFGLAIFIAFGEKVYALFLMQILLFSLESLSLENFDYQYLYPWGASFASGTKTFWGAASVVVFIQLLRKLLEIKKQQRLLFRLLLILTLACTPHLVIAPVLQTCQLDQLSAATGSVAFFLLLSATIFLAVKRQEARLFASGFAIYLTLMGIYVPIKSGMLAINIKVDLFPFLSASTQFLFVCFDVCLRIIKLGKDLDARNRDLSATNTLLTQEIRLREELSERLETQRRAVEETERLRVMGEMSRNIAHEVNTPLSIVSFKLQNLRVILANQFKSDSEALTICNTSLIIIERAASIVRTMRLLARDGTRDQIANVSASATISQILIICNERAAAAQIRIKIDCPSSDIIFRAREAAIFQMLTNLTNNAIDALKNYERKEKTIDISVEKQDSHIIFKVTDNGPGVPVEVEEKIFEPFFTTKPGSTGMGIGLCLARSVAMEHGGNLVLESRANPTRFACTITIRH